MMTDATTILKTVFFKASRETVWAFLTEKDKLAAWFHPTEADLAEGQDYTCVRLADDGTTIRQIWGRVIEMDKPVRLVTSFTIAPFDGKETIVTWDLQEAAGGTRLSLKHEGITDAAGPAAIDLLMALDHGWDQHFNNLREAVRG